MADVAISHAGDPVTVDVLANDTPNPQLPIDENSLSIVASPSHGSGVLNADHTITYTPNKDDFGADSFDYQVCSQVVQVAGRAAAQQGCDIATVSITVTAPVIVVKGTTTTTRAGSDGTQSTAASQHELPHTGRSSAPLALAGIGLCALGAIAAATRRRRGDAKA